MTMLNMAPASHMSTDTINGPSAPPNSPADLNMISLQTWHAMSRDTGFGGNTVQFWSRLYWCTKGEDGKLVCNSRMGSWLRSLPIYVPETFGRVENFVRVEPPCERWARQRSVSAPPTPPRIGAEHQMAQTSVVNAAAGHLPAPNVQTMGTCPTADNSQHPNPLGQHPVRHEQKPQPAVPQRLSSLLFQDSSQGANNPDSAKQGSALQGNIISRFQALHLGGRSGGQTAHSANMDTDEDEAKPLTGYDSSNKVQNKKRAHSIVRTDTSASQPPSKKLRRTLTSARNRLSRVLTPAGGLHNPTEDRQIRVDSITEAAGRMSLASPPQMVQVTGFPPGGVKERVKIAILGNHGVGKTSFLEAFRTNGYDAPKTSPTAYQLADGYDVDTIYAVLDGVSVACEAWDVSSQCDGREYTAQSVRPLMTTFFDVVIICHDVSDETTLRAVENKWASRAERYCTGSPTIVLGLKTDLRKPLPSLRLVHLREPTQTSCGHGEQIAKKIAAEAYYEASAKTGEGVADFFESTMRYALQRRVRRGDGGVCAVRGPVSRAKKAWRGIKKHF